MRYHLHHWPGAVLLLSQGQQRARKRCPGEIDDDEIMEGRAGISKEHVPFGEADSIEFRNSDPSNFPQNKRKARRNSNDVLDENTRQKEETQTGLKTTF